MISCFIFSLDEVKKQIQFAVSSTYSGLILIKEPTHFSDVVNFIFDYEPLLFGVPFFLNVSTHWEIVVIQDLATISDLKYQFRRLNDKRGRSTFSYIYLQAGKNDESLIQLVNK